MMRTTRIGVVIAAGLLAGALGTAAPALANPGSHGRGGEQTNRYNAQGCQQGGHQARVEAETGRTFTNSGNCTSHTARGGGLTAASGQITLTGSSQYACATPGGQCWGILSVSGAPANATVQILYENGAAASLPVKTGPTGSYDGVANAFCDVDSPNRTVRAVVYDTSMVSAWTTATC